MEENKIIWLIGFGAICYIVEACFHLADSKKHTGALSHIWHSFGLIFRFIYACIFFRAEGNLFHTFIFFAVFSLLFSAFTAVSIGKPFWWVSNKGLDLLIRKAVNKIFPNFKFDR